MIHNRISIERAILSTMLYCDFTPQTKEIAKFKLDEKYFSHPVHKTVVRVITKLQKNGYPPLDVYVQEVLKIENKDSFFQNAYIDILAANPFSSVETLGRLYNILKKRHNEQLLKAIK